MYRHALCPSSESACWMKLVSKTVSHCSLHAAAGLVNGRVDMGNHPTSSSEVSLVRTGSGSESGSVALELFGYGRLAEVPAARVS